MSEKSVIAKLNDFMKYCQLNSILFVVVFLNLTLHQFHSFSFAWQETITFQQLESATLGALKIRNLRCLSVCKLDPEPYKETGTNKRIFNFINETSLKKIPMENRVTCPSDPHSHLRHSRDAPTMAQFFILLFFFNFIKIVTKN